MATVDETRPATISVRAAAPSGKGGRRGEVDVEIHLLHILVPEAAGNQPSARQKQRETLLCGWKLGGALRASGIDPLTDAYELVLSTCFPFDAVTPGPERYLLHATMIGSAG